MRKVFPAIIILLLLVRIGHGQASADSTYSIGVAGDSSDVVTKTQFGVVLAGGSTDVDEAMKWMMERTGGGDFLVIRASGSTGYNDYLKELSNVNSVETLLIDNREKAMSPAVGKRIREAEGLFLAGGDQWNYVRYWTNSEVSSAIQYLITQKKIPIGGTSAGCAVLTEIIFDSRSGSATAATLADPYDTLVRISQSFIEIPFLKNTIADQHYAQRERLGRHVVFMARMTKDFDMRIVKGIGVDEKTAVCVDAEGNAKVIGHNNAYFLMAKEKPEKCSPKVPLTWDHKKKAISAYIFPATLEGTTAFNLNKWPTATPTEYWSVKDGILIRTKVEK